MIHPAEQKRTLHRVTKRLLLGVAVATGLLGRGLIKAQPQPD
jgi:hypothetical protein